MNPNSARLVSIALLVMTIFTPSSSVVAQDQFSFPDLVAASSANGVFLVVWEYEYTHPKADPKANVAPLKQATFHVFAKEGFPQDRFSRAGTYWSFTAASWGVAVQDVAWPGGFLPFVSNNGDYLVLVAATPPVSGKLEVMRIYRKSTEQGGALIATHQLQDLWPQDQVAPLDLPRIIQERPLWYDGGGFDFSPDNQQLIYKTRWGNTVRVNLADGKVSKD